MIQPIYQSFGVGTTVNADYYGSPISWQFSSVLGHVESVLPVACSFTYMKVAARSALPFGTLTFTIYKNGIATSLACVIADTDGTATITSGNTVSFSAGDSVYIRTVRGGGVNPSVGFDYELGVETTVDDGSLYGWGTSAANMTNLTEHAGAFSGMNFDFDTSSPANIAAADMVGVGGNITALSVAIESAPGVGKSDIFTLLKNGVAQDGSGGTVNTTTTVADAATSALGTFTLPVSSGDTVSVRHTSTGSPSGRKCAGLTAFVSDTPSAWQFIGRSITNLISGTAPHYNFPYLSQTALSTTNDDYLRVLGTRFTLHSLLWKVLQAPDTGSSWTLTLLKNGADTAQSETISDTNKVAGGDNTTPVSFSIGDTASVKATAANSPDNSSQHFWTFFATLSVPVVATSIIGQGGTVSGLSRVHLVNVDGVTRTLSSPDLEGSAVVGGNLTMYEQSAAPAAVADVGRMWFEDNGSGKMRLMCQFPTGAAQQLAIEP